mmetsp:Transcript_31963/g.92849  ORF Transcript_31963/g.92849 Transcript_31963/m.92849 type:complete len:240 (-) Transcript_31963:252-971(-)
MYQKARQSLVFFTLPGNTGQGDEAIAHGGTCEPFVATKEKAAGCGCGGGGIRPHIGPSLLFCHAHSHSGAHLILDRRVGRIVVTGAQLVHPDLSQVPRCLAPQSWHGSEAHDQRTAMTCLHLVLEEHGGASEDMRPATTSTARPRSRLVTVALWHAPRPPGEVSRSSLHTRTHEGVVRRVKVDLVHSTAHPVMRAEDWRVAVGKIPVLEHLRTAHHTPMPLETLLSPGTAKGPHSSLES